MLTKQRLLKACVLAYLLLLFVGSFIMIAVLRSGLADSVSTGNSNLLLQLKPYFYYAFAGSIGGTLYCLRLFYWHNIIGKIHIEKWWIWYLLRPVMSAGTAVMMILLFKSGILLIQNSSLASSIGLSFLVGYGFGKVMDKLDGLTETLFNGHPNPANRPQDPSKEQTDSNQSTDPVNGSKDPDQPLQQIKPQ